MTENQIPQQPQYQPSQAFEPFYNTPQPSPAPEKPKRKFAIVAIIIGALLLGGAAGAAAKPPVEKIVEVEKTVTEFRTPASCIEGFDLAEDIFTSSSTTMGYMQEALQAAARLDAAGIQRNIPKVDDETQKLKVIGPKYRAAREDCLAK